MIQSKHQPAFSVMPPVSQAELERWKAFGGSVQEANGRKTYITPAKKKLKTWKEANQMMEESEDVEMQQDGIFRIH